MPEEKISDMLGPMPGVEDEAAPVVEQTDQQQPVQEARQPEGDGRVRDERGRFAPKPGDDAQPTEQQPAPEPAANPQEQAFAAMRRKIEELEARVKAQPEQPQPPPREPQTEDEVRFVHHLNQSEARTRAMLAMQMGGDVERAQQYLDGAKQYFNSLPQDAQNEIRFSEEPYAELALRFQAAINQRQQQEQSQRFLQRMSEWEAPVNTIDPEAWEKWALSYAQKKAAEARANAAQTQPQQQPPPRSILDIPSAGSGNQSHIPTGADMLQDVFGR